MKAAKRHCKLTKKGFEVTGRAVAALSYGLIVAVACYESATGNVIMPELALVFTGLYGVYLYAEEDDRGSL